MYYFPTKTQPILYSLIIVAFFVFLQSSLDARHKRGLIAGAAFGYSQGITFWVFALLFYMGAVMVDKGIVEYGDFFTSMFAVMFGAFGVGQVRELCHRETCFRPKLLHWRRIVKMCV